MIRHHTHINHTDTSGSFLLTVTQMFSLSKTICSCPVQSAFHISHTW